MATRPNCLGSLPSWRYCVGARLKFWRRSRVPKKGSRDEAGQISLDYYTIPLATQATASAAFVQNLVQQMLKKSWNRVAFFVFSPTVLRCWDACLASCLLFGWTNEHYKPQARFSGDSKVQRHDLRIFLKGEAPSLLFWTKGYITSRDPEPILKLSTMFVLLSNLSSSTLNPVYLKWTPNVVAIHVHCRKHNIK